jgi:uncharacterized membrane protein YphA (DoxX/SURF4 family)
MLGELAIGIALILGIATRYASLFTFVYLIIATALARVSGNIQRRRWAINMRTSARTLRSWAER